jgi:hypothetical protein
LNIIFGRSGKLEKNLIAKMKFFTASLQRYGQNIIMKKKYRIRKINMRNRLLRFFLFEKTDSK